MTLSWSLLMDQILELSHFPNVYSPNDHQSEMRTFLYAGLGIFFLLYKITEIQSCCSEQHIAHPFVLPFCLPVQQILLMIMQTKVTQIYNEVVFYKEKQQPTTSCTPLNNIFFSIHLNSFGI